MFKNCKDSKSFFDRYFKVLNQTARKINLNDLDQILQILKSNIKKRSNIFVAGNGGAASVSNHFLCDFNKGIKISSKKKLLPKVISLANSIEYITATSNDIKFSEIFSSLL
jgi:D-sedoheptulose 7-phosphate isomerase